MSTAPESPRVAVPPASRLAQSRPAAPVRYSSPRGVRRSRHPPGRKRACRCPQGRALAVRLAVNDPLAGVNRHPAAVNPLKAAVNHSSAAVKRPPAPVIPPEAAVNHPTADASWCVAAWRVLPVHCGVRQRLTRWSRRARPTDVGSPVLASPATETRAACHRCCACADGSELPRRARARAGIGAPRAGGGKGGRK